MHRQLAWLIYNNLIAIIFPFLNTVHNCPPHFIHFQIFFSVFFERKKLVTRLPNFSQNIIKLKKNLGIFHFGGGMRGGEVVGVILFIPRTVSKHKRQLLPCKVCAILYLSKERVANPHPRM